MHFLNLRKRTPTGLARDFLKLRKERPTDPRAGVFIAEVSLQDIRMAKPHFMTAVPCSPASDLPKSCLYAPPLLLQPTCSSAVLPLSLSRPPPSLSARAAIERSGNTLKGFKDFHLKAKAITWPLLFCVCHDRSASVSFGTRCMLGATSASRSRFRAKQPNKRV